MDIVRHSDADSFYARALDLLLEREAENNLIIGIALRLQQSGGENLWGEGESLLVTMERENEIVGAAVRTPPHSLILTRVEAPALPALAERMHAWGEELPGVLGPREAAARFVTAWTGLTGAKDSPPLGMRIYQLERVSPVQRVPGHAEWATEEEFELARAWAQAFSDEADTGDSDPAASARRTISERRLLFWKDPGPVSMAACMGPTPNGIRIGLVYTPPEYRRRGFASALVANLSQQMLDSGRRFCYLFTDLANPTSNSIYQRIGYQIVCDFDNYRFE